MTNDIDDQPNQLNESNETSINDGNDPMMIMEIVMIFREMTQCKPEILIISINDIVKNQKWCESINQWRINQIMKKKWWRKPMMRGRKYYWNDNIDDDNINGMT